MIYCALIGNKEGELFKWGSGSDWWGRERLIATSLEGETRVYAEESQAAFEIVERLYREWTRKFAVAEGCANAVSN